MKKPIIISIVNHKGGTGKTTVTHNLAVALDLVLNKKRKESKRMLIIDNDPQANMTVFLHPNPQDLKEEDTIMEIYKKQANENADIIMQSKFENIDFVANIYFAEDLENQLASDYEGYLRLKFFLENQGKDYDIVIIDNHPDFGIFTKNSLLISDYVLVPAFPEMLSLVGIKQIIDNIESIKRVNANLELLGILINRFNETIKGHRKDRLQLYKYFGEKIMITEIHQAAAITNAQNKRLSVAEFDKKVRAHTEFLSLAKEVASKIGFNVKYDPDKEFAKKFDLTTEEE